MIIVHAYLRCRSEHRDTYRDYLRAKVRDGARVVNKAVYLASGIGCDGV